MSRLLRALQNYTTRISAASLVLLTFAQLAAGQAQPAVGQRTDWQLTSGALVHPQFRGPIPKRSDVVFSTRTKRDDAIASAKAFHATRVEWSYVADKKFVDDMKSFAPVFGGALTPYESNAPDEAVAKDFEGQSIQNPRMKSWPGGGRMLTTTHPAARKMIFERVGKYVAAGATALQIDDPGFQAYAAQRWHGDFNEATLAGFKAYAANELAKKPQFARGMEKLKALNYNAFLSEAFGIKTKEDYARRSKDLPSHPMWLGYLQSTVDQFYTDLKTQLKTLRPEGMPISMNLIFLTRPDESSLQFFLVKHADYSIAEIYTTDPREVIMRAATARSFGLGFVGSIVPKSLPETRTAIALLYAWGANPIVPWDVYEGTDKEGKPKRYFGTVADFADLFKFVRDNPSIFDNYELAAVVGIPIPTARYRDDRTMNFIRKLVDHNVPFAFIPVGGALSSKASQALRAPKVLVRVNDEKDFGSEDLASIKAAGRPVLAAERMSDAAIQALAPVKANVQNKQVPRIFMIPRADKQGRIALHVIQPSVDAGGKSETMCAKEIEFKENPLGQKRVSGARWIDRKGSHQVSTATGQNIAKFQIPTCSAWGILALQ